MQLGNSSSIQFVISNENPVPVTIRKLKKAYDVIIAFIEHWNWSKEFQESSSTKFMARFRSGISNSKFRDFRIFIKTVFRSTRFIHDRNRFWINISCCVQNGEGVIYIKSRSYFTWKSLENVFPGKMCSINFQVYSTFQHDMQLLRFSTLSYDPRIYFEKFSASC